MFNPRSWHCFCFLFIDRRRSRTPDGLGAFVSLVCHCNKLSMCVFSEKTVSPRASILRKVSSSEDIVHSSSLRLYRTTISGGSPSPCNENGHLLTVDLCFCRRRK